MIRQQFILKKLSIGGIVSISSVYITWQVQKLLMVSWVGTSLTLLLVVSNLYADNRHLWGVYQSQDLTIQPQVGTPTRVV